MKPTHTSEIRWPRRITTPGEAVRFIDAHGYCVLYPITGWPLPSLHFAVTGRDPHVEHKWDEKSEMVWRWKDELPLERRAFYGKYFKGRGTFLSLEFLSRFLAMNQTALAPGDHARFYDEGRISSDARVIWEALAKHGPLPTLALRHAGHMEGLAGNRRFKKAILELERRLIVVHFGTKRETAAWASGRFELTCRAFPEQTAEARQIAPDAARQAIAAKFLEWHPAAPREILRRIFGWSKKETLAAFRQPIQ
jgi:hypothetical protein